MPLELVVGASFVDDKGTLAQPPKEHPHLRATRKLEARICGKIPGKHRTNIGKCLYFFILNRG